MMKGIKSHRKLMKASVLEGSTVIMRQAQPKYNFQISSKSKKETNGRKSAPVANCSSQYEQGMDLSVMSNRAHPSTSTATRHLSSVSSPPPIYAKDLRCSNEIHTDQQNTNNHQAHVSFSPISFFFLWEAFSSEKFHILNCIIKNLHFAALHLIKLF